MEKSRTGLVAALTVLSLAAPPLGAATLDETIAEHVAAHGGAEAWDAIRSMKVTGTFTAFSNVSPFTLQRKRENSYHMDHLLDDKRVVIGYDGKTAWWDNPWMQEGVQKVTGPDLAVLTRDVEFETPLFNYAKKGHRVELLGTVDLEGMPAVGIELTRSDESVETWYLDPESHLAIARDSPGSDFGQPMPQRTFFDDYRPVHGAMLPHYVETQWYTRDRVMRVDGVEVNLAIDDALFRMPATPGMGPLQPLVGNWDVAVSQRNGPEAPWQETERVSTLESTVGGTLLQERFTTEEGHEIVWMLSYDRFKERYRMTLINSMRGLLDVQEGGFDEDGRLVVSNLETGTTWETRGMTIHTRVSIFDIGDDGFTTEYEVSLDGGETWFVAVKSSYSRRTADG